MFASRTPKFAFIATLTVALLAVVRLAGQDDTTLRILSREGTRTIALTGANRQYVELDELASIFQLTVREEAGALTVTHASQTIVLTLDRTLASAAGRLVSLSAAPVRAGGRVLVPVDFISRALAPVYDIRLDLRRNARLVIVGDLRVPQVTVRHESRAGSEHVIIDITPRLGTSVAQVDNRITVGIQADALDVTVLGIPPSPLLQAVRTLDPATIVLQTGPQFGGYRTNTEIVGTTERVNIDLLPVAVETAAPLPAAIDPPLAEGEAPPLLTPEPTMFRTVVIDPGHGGDDQGVRGPNGLLEKDLTLSVARRLKASLEARLGLRVLLTRDDDRFVPIDRRAALANNNKAGVFVSLHANASPRESTRGLAVYVAAFDEDAEARASLARERVSVIGGGVRELEIVSWDFAQIRHADRSWQLATMLAGRMQGRVPLDTPSVARIPFRVLEAANMPAVLIEMGYLTNIDQAGGLAGADFQGTLAQAIAEALVQFRGLQGGDGSSP